MKLTVSKYPVKKSRGYDFRPRGFIFLLAAILTAGFVAVSMVNRTDDTINTFVNFLSTDFPNHGNVFFGENEKLINQR